MPKPKDAESFEVADDKRYRQHDNVHSMIVQAANDYVTPDPSRNFTVKVQGDRVEIKCHCYEQGLGDPTRLQMQLQAMGKASDDYLKVLKKRVRDQGGGNLKLKELKDLRGFDRQKVNLNDRWLISYHRVYELEGLIQNPEE